jgi:hypothetical protein
MQLNVQSRRPKTTSSVPLQQQTVNFPYNYGTGSHHKSKIHSTLCKLHAPTQTCRHMKPYMAHTIGIGSPLPPWDARPSYTNPPRREDHGEHRAQTRGTLVHQYFAPKTQAYRISGSAELFPQHCQVPYMTAKDQLKVVTEEMITTLTKLTATKQWQILTEVHAKLADDALQPCGPAFLTSPCHAWMLPDDDHQRAPQEAHMPVLQRVAPETPTPHVNPAPSL